MNLQALRQQKSRAIQNAKKFLQSGDTVKAVEYRKLAEKLDRQIREAERLASLDSKNRPALPTGNGQKLVAGVKAAPARDNSGENNNNGGAQLSAHGENNKDRAAYLIRFGEPNAAVKGILTDLHGSDYEAAYWRQRSAFTKYLRRGDQVLDRSELDMLKQIILTPEAVKMALARGIDSVKSIKATMVEAVDTLGGFAVPVDFQTRVIERLQGLTVMRGRASVDQTSRDTVEFPVATGSDDQYTSAVRVTWVDETPVEGVANTNLTFGQETIPVHTVMAEAFLSRNLVEDAAFDIEGYLVRKFSEAAAIDEDNKFLVGSGAGTPQGILPGGTNLLGLSEVNSGSASALTWDGLLALRYKIASQYRNNAVWIANRSTYLAIAQLKTSGGEYLWSPYQFAGGAEGEPPRLQGHEPLEQEAMPDVAANAYPIIFGDPSGYQIIDRVGMTVERYLDGSTARKNMILYVMRRRLGGQVVESWRFAVQRVAA